MLPQNAEGAGLSTPMWDLVQMCWRQDPAERPTIDVVVKTLEDLLKNDGCVQRTSNDYYYGTFVPNPGDLFSEPQATPPPAGTGDQQTPAGEHLLSSRDITNSSTRCLDSRKAKKFSIFLKNVKKWLC